MQIDVCMFCHGYHPTCLLCNELLLLLLSVNGPVHHLLPKLHNLYNRKNNKNPFQHGLTKVNTTLAFVVITNTHLMPLS